MERYGDLVQFSKETENDLTYHFFIYSNEHGSEFELILIESFNPEIESISIDIKRLEEYPLFNKINKFMEDFFHQNDLNDQISYVIWGGVAANLMLNAIGRTDKCYSYHDIELFLIKNENIYLPNELIEKLKKSISSNGHFLLDLGGIPIVQNFNGMNVNDFQKQRVSRKDGDLILNNVILSINRVKQQVIMKAPKGTFLNIISGDNSIKMKNASDLQDIHQISRRIYRNISKSIRLEEAANLVVYEETMHSLERLIKDYILKLDYFFNNSISQSEDKKFIKKWILLKNIENIEIGEKWLYKITLSETSKRLAGLRGVNSLDFPSFCRIFLPDNPNSISLFNHPLIHLIRRDWKNPAWPEDIEERFSIIKDCYCDFIQYQKPDAEKMFD